MITSPACNGGRQIPLRAPFVNNRIDPALFALPAVNVTKILPTTSDPCGQIRFGRKTNSDENVYIAIRDAFDATRRLLEDHVRERRGEVKLHAVPDHGRVARLLPEQNCGFILSADGNEIYFHRNSVTNGGFDKLALGDEVRFVAQHSESAEGPQASTVVALGKHHLPPTAAVRA